MGLTKNSTGFLTAQTGTEIFNIKDNQHIIALAGNPNVGKSTVFNNLTGMNQHTGNWPGKTVESAVGIRKHNDKEFAFVDLPGTYSLLAHSKEEEVARDFICFGNPEVTVVVCDATCLERNLNLVLQTYEIQKNLIVCVNLLDEAKRKSIHIDINKLSELLGVPVIGIVARRKKTLDPLLETIDKNLDTHTDSYIKVEYCSAIEECISILEKALSKYTGFTMNIRWLAVKILENRRDITEKIQNAYSVDLNADHEISNAVKECERTLERYGFGDHMLKDKIANAFVKKAEDLAKQVVVSKSAVNVDRKIDKYLTGKATGFPMMILMLMVIFWITITGANYPSELLSRMFLSFEPILSDVFAFLHFPQVLNDLLILGVYRVLTWVISVMLPPMAIFFPLFTLLEDLGYLPRVAFNLDHFFKKSNACGKQALTMCMSFGCNAAGIVGTRIIDSPRERLLAVTTNNFIPCNGRFPMLISIITMFFLGTGISVYDSFLSALILAGIICFGIFMTLQTSKLLSKTILKGVPSSFTLELPPYRKPQIGKIIVRSIFDRTLFVLGRAVAVAAPAGLIIWLMANLTIGDATLLKICADFLDPFGRLIGMDGVIVMAFILGFPANEIVIPITIMTYMANGNLEYFDNLASVHTLLVSNGWTMWTAVCVMLFTLMHWPCSTTGLTIYKETKSLKWTLVSFLLPTACGILICFFVNLLSKII